MLVMKHGEKWLVDKFRHSGEAVEVDSKRMSLGFDSGEDELMGVAPRYVRGGGGTIRARGFERRPESNMRAIQSRAYVHNFDAAAEGHRTKSGMTVERRLPSTL